jgi:hypothetical protein
LLKAQRKDIAQMHVGIDMKFAQQPLGAFDHHVSQGGCQGLQTLRCVGGPPAPLGDADALVAHEAFETDRGGGKLVHAFALSRQDHAAHQSERDGILRVAGQSRSA